MKKVLCVGRNQHQVKVLYYTRDLAGVYYKYNISIAFFLKVAHSRYEFREPKTKKKIKIINKILLRYSR